MPLGRSNTNTRRRGSSRRPTLDKALLTEAPLSFDFSYLSYFVELKCNSNGKIISLRIHNHVNANRGTKAM